VNILLTCADNRNDDETSIFIIDGGPSNRRQEPDLKACLVGLRSHLQSHQGRCSRRTGPKYVGFLVCTESLGMNVGYTNSFLLRFLSKPRILLRAPLGARAYP
jgi:hypothetical protein